MQEMNQHLAQRLKGLRSELGWSLDVAARETGVSKAMLGQIERGESSPTVATLWKIATGFRVSFSSFIEPTRQSRGRCSIAPQMRFASSRRERACRSPLSSLMRGALDLNCLS